MASRDDFLSELCVESQTILQGHFLHVQRDKVRLPDGQMASREYVQHPGAVMIVPILSAENTGAVQLVMERQYRHPLRRVFLEFPAGKLDAGEHPLICAQRELREETGYQAAEWARAGVLHPTIAYSNEAIEIWFARGLQLGERALDSGEFLDVVQVSSAQLLQGCAQGEVTDAKTLIGAFWLQNVLQGAWSLNWQTADALMRAP